MAAEIKKNNTNNNFYQSESPDNKKSKPFPVAEQTYFIFNDMKKGEMKRAHFTLRNIGGSYKDFIIFVLEPEPFLKITETTPLSKDQQDKLPVKVYFEAKAPDWSRTFTNTIIIRLDNEDEKVTVELNTQTKPVDDFAHIFKPQEIRKITSLINKLEKNTSAEIAVVTEDSLEGRDIAEYANELFNEWGIGKEDKHNGILLLIDKEETKFRIEVGLGLNDVLTPDFINGLFEQYLIPNFKLKKFGPGVYKTLDKIAKKITALYKKRI